MKIENLKVGQVLKNYKALCEVLEIEPKTVGKAKGIQEKEIKQYINYHKEGHKIIIDEIYQKVVEKVDKRTLGNNNHQARCVRYLLLDLLSKYKLEEHEVLGFSKGLLLRNLRLVNSNYSTAKVNRKEYAQVLEVEKLAIDECIEYVDNRSINLITKAIQVLIRQKVITYKSSYTWIDKKGNINHANISEEKDILDAEYEVMKTMKIGLKKYVYEYGRWDEFKNKVSEYLLKNHGKKFKDFKYYYSSFHFNYNLDNLKDYKSHMEQNQDMSKEIAIEEIQKLWSESLETTINNTHKKNKKSLAWGTSANTLLNYRSSEEYISEQVKIKNSMVDLEHKKIESEQLKLNLESIADAYESENNIPF